MLAPTVACDLGVHIIGIRDVTTLELYNEMESIGLPLLISIPLLNIYKVS